MRNGPLEHRTLLLLLTCVFVTVGGAGCSEDRAEFQERIMQMKEFYAQQSIYEDTFVLKERDSEKIIATGTSSWKRDEGLYHVSMRFSASSRNSTSGDCEFIYIDTVDPSKAITLAKFGKGGWSILSRKTIGALIASQVPVYVLGLLSPNLAPVALMGQWEVIDNVGALPADSGKHQREIFVDSGGYIKSLVDDDIRLDISVRKPALPEARS